MSLTEQELGSLASLKLKSLPYIQKLWGKQRTVRYVYRGGRLGVMNDSFHCSLTEMSSVSFSAIKRPQWLRMRSWSDRTYSTRSSSCPYCSLASFNCRGYSMRPAHQQPCPSLRTHPQEATHLPDWASGRSRPSFGIETI